jgi:hypothetical protein
MTKPESKTPEWLIERLALGELDEKAAADVRARLAAEGRSADAEVAAIAASNKEILETLPPARIAAAVRGRAAAGRKSRWLMFAPLALAGAAAVALVGRPTRQPDSIDVGYEGIKGNTKVLVYRRGAEKNERLSEGARATRGDLLQLAYKAGAGEAFTAEFGALLSIDGRGHVTVHWPEGDAGTSARLSHKGEIKLPSAYELDDAPAFERFFFVTSDAPFAMAPVLDAARALASRPDARTSALSLPSKLFQTSLTLDKTR